MRLADPYLLGLLALLPLLLFLKSRFEAERGSGRFSSLALLGDYRPTWRIRHRWLPTALRAVALGLVVVALARPQTGRAETELPGRGIDIVLVLDTSSSMELGFSRDGATRLATAQNVIRDFISGREEDRIGLVVFRDESLVLSPLTLDYDALQRLLENVRQPNLADGTAIGLGLGEGLNLIRDSRARSRVVVLLTDGENNNRTLEPLAAARVAESLGIRVYTIGLIDEASRRSGRGVNVDERALREIADLTGGRYFPAESEAALAAIYASIDELEKSRVGRPRFAAFNELAVYFLIAALALLAAETGLRTTVWRRAA